MRPKSNTCFFDDIRTIFQLLLKGKFSDLLLAPTENALLQFCRYCLVGGLATIVDWVFLYTAEKLGFHYLVAAVIGFFGGLVCNYTISKFMVFNAETSKLEPKREFLAYGAIGVVGLVLTLVLMYIMTDWLGLYFMLSKVIATVLVLIWNFLARKYLLY